MKKIILIISFFLLSLFLFLQPNLRTDAKSTNLFEVSKTAHAACETGSYGGFTFPCRRVWCSSTYSYAGCGFGNGLNCNTSKAC